MNSIVSVFEDAFEAIPLPLLEVWGRLAYIIGFGLMICSFGRFTLRPGGRWGLGRERQSWDQEAFLSIPISFVLIIASGYVGSSIVLVPGAQTFESLKDLVVFLCIMLFGYPALITVPFAYCVSDLIEGVPPQFLLSWLPGYFINTGCFWIASQFLGKNPDFRRPRIWINYLGFVFVFMSIQPVMWGYICSSKFTEEISYRAITPTLSLTMTFTWLAAPLAMLVALPFVRKLGLFWAEIPGHVKERRLGKREWIWESGGAAGPQKNLESGLPIRMVILAPFTLLILLMVGTTAYVTLRSAAKDSELLARRLHQEIAANIHLQLRGWLTDTGEVQDRADVSELLRDLPISTHGRAFILDPAGGLIGSSTPAEDPVVASAIQFLGKTTPGGLGKMPTEREFRFIHVSAKPVSRETWLAHAASALRPDGRPDNWIVVTAMPETYYLSGLQTGNSRSAMMFALALVLSLGVAAMLAARISIPIQRISSATKALVRGNLSHKLPASSLQELNILTQSFNDMVGRLKQNFDDLSDEIELRKKAVQLLRQERDYADTVLNSLPGVFYHYDENLRFVRWNKNFQRISGYNSDEIAAASPLLFFADDEKEIVGSRIKEVFEKGESSVAADFLLKDGTRVPYLFTGMRFDHGGQRHLIGIGSDVSENKRMEIALRESVARFDAAARATGDVVWDWDLATGQIWWNDNFQTLFGYRAEEIGPDIGSWVGRIHPDEKESVVSHIHDVIGGGKTLWTAEYRFLRGDGTYADVLDSGQVLRDASGRGVRMVGAIQDITERKRAHARLLAFNAELEKRVADRTRELEMVNKELESFCYSVSHDLRAPLRGIAGFSEILIKNHSAALDDKARNYLQRVLAATHRMGELIDDLLLLSQVSRDEMHIAEVDLSAIAHEIFDNLRQNSPERKVRVNVHEGMISEGDGRLIRVMLENLIGNAWKFTSKVSDALINFTASNEKGIKIFTISDNGAGFDMRYANKLFGPFQRLHRVTEFPGTGIGLATVLRVVNRHGGHISAHAQLDKGATFQFSFNTRP